MSTEMLVELFPTCAVGPAGVAMSRLAAAGRTLKAPILGSSMSDSTATRVSVGVSVGWQGRTPLAFSCSKEALPDRTVISLRGELDIASAKEFGDCIDSAIAGLGTLLELDLADLSFIDTRGVREIRRALSIVRGRGGDMAISSPSAIVYKVLRLTGFTDILRVDQHSRGSVTR
jgi:anti-sigma B factor antagonist